MTSDVAVGDRVRVDVEGMVTYISVFAGEAVGVRLDDGKGLFIDEGVPLEIVKRRPYKVGDVIEKGTDDPNLPTFTVLVYETYTDRYAIQLGRNGQWQFMADADILSPGYRWEVVNHSPLTVVYIPPQSGDSK